MSPDERRSVGALAVLYCFRMLGLFMVLPLLALYAADLPGATPTLIGLAIGVYGLMQALLQVPLGWLSDRVGRKPVIVGGLLLFALGSVVAAMADSIEGIVLGRLLQGAGAIASTVMAMVADLTREEQRTKAMALVGASIGVSFILALVLGPLVASLSDLAGVFWFTALLAISGIVLVIWAVP
ncbi:MAG: MFS transporter, partial [Halieaceae bacterium]|nr:MFS transporter [Halieaceae bacterium]